MDRRCFLRHRSARGRLSRLPNSIDALAALPRLLAIFCIQPQLLAKREALAKLPLLTVFFAVFRTCRDLLSIRGLRVRIPSASLRDSRKS